MNFLKKIFSDKKNISEPKIIVTDIRLETYDINGNLMSDEEVEKMLELSRNQQAERKKERLNRQKEIDALKSNRNAPSEWLNNFLTTCQKNYENVSYEMIGKLYFEHMNAQREAEKSNDYKKAYMYSQNTFSLIPKFIEGEIKMHGAFDIKSMPSVEFNMKYTSIMGLVGGFKNISEMINYNPELKYLYQEQLSEYEILLDLSKKIRNLVKTNPDILQNTLKKELQNYEPRLINDSCCWMEKFDLLSREKIKNTYKLKLTY